MRPDLDRILETTRAGLPALRARRDEVVARAAEAPVPRRFLARRDPSRLALIAEVKRRSPSVGEIAASLDPVEHAKAYASAGASAISVLTDGPFFGGSLNDLRDVAAAVEVPVLRKDFILDELQIAEARAAGAAAILLIVRALAPARLKALARAAAEWELDPLVEIHNARELDTALHQGFRLIGVNSRDLDSLTIDVDAAWALIARIPSDVVAIAESGMATEADVRQAAAAGADAVLIGTALSASPDPSGLAARLGGVPRSGR